MSETVTRAEFEARITALERANGDLREVVRELAGIVNTAISETNCTDKRSLLLDGALRDWMAQRLTPEGKAREAVIARLIAREEAAEIARQRSGTRWGVAALGLGVILSAWQLAENVGEAVIRAIWGAP